MTPLDRLPEDTRARLVAMLERGALTPEAERDVREYLRRRVPIAAGGKDPGPTTNQR